MDSSVQIAIIGGAVSVVVAMLSFVLTNWQKRQDELHERKFAYYKELLEAISDTAINPTDKATERLASAMNTIGLIAPQPVITALMTLHNYIKPSNQNFSTDQHDSILQMLLLKIRQSLGIRGDNPKDFTFHLVGGKNQKNPSKR